MQKLYPAYKENYVTVSANSSDEYVPYLSVYLLSIKENSSPDTNYDIVILEKSITDRNKDILKELFETSSNFSLRFYNPSKLFEDKNIPVMHPYLSKESYFRLSAPLIFQNYKRLIFTDADLIFNEDPAVLYDMEMNNNCILSAVEPVWSSWINSNTVMDSINIIDYTKNVLKLKNPHKYFNTGVMLLDIKKLNELNATDKFLEKISGDTKYFYQDQDVINEVLQDKIGVLPFEWNGEILIPQNYENANDDIKKYCETDKKNIIHWIGSGKPWVTFDKKLTEQWWNIARKSPFYEIIIDRKIDRKVNVLKGDISHQIKEKNKLKEEIINIKDNILKHNNEQNILKKDVLEVKKDINNNYENNNILKNEIVKLKENAVKTSETNQKLTQNINKNENLILEINNRIKQSSLQFDNTEKQIEDIHFQIDENSKALEETIKQILTEKENNNNLKEQLTAVNESLAKTGDTVSSQTAKINDLKEAVIKSSEFGNNLQKEISNQKIQIDNEIKANNDLKQSVLNLKNDIYTNFNEIQTKIDINQNDTIQEIQNLKETSNNLKNEIEYNQNDTLKEIESLKEISAEIKDNIDYKYNDLQTKVNENYENTKHQIIDIHNLITKQDEKYENLKENVLSNKDSILKIKDEIIKTKEEIINIKETLLKTQEYFNTKIESLKQENMKKVEETKLEIYEKTIQETLLLYNFKHNRFNYNKYKVLKNILFGELRQKYAEKEEYLKNQIKLAENIIRGKNE